MTQETLPKEKPIHAKPQLYAYYFLGMKEIAKEYGYNLVVHGSMNRDLDLIAIPWVDDPKPELELLQALSLYLTGKSYNRQVDYWANKLPGGRNVYTIDLYRGGYTRNKAGQIIDPVEFTEDPQYYIDISVTPSIPANPVE